MKRNYELCAPLVIKRVLSQCKVLWINQEIRLAMRNRHRMKSKGDTKVIMYGEICV